MELLGAVAAILLTQVGYASGVILVSRRKESVPGLLDLATLVALWTLVLLVRPAVGKWLAILLGLVLGGVTGGIVTALFAGKDGGDSGRRVGARRSLRGLREGWKAFAMEMGNYQGRVFMGLFYFLVLNPFALGSRLVRDPLRLRPSAGDSFWLERSRADDDLERARSQY